MKRLFLLLTIILAFGIMNAQETFSFRTNHPQGFSIESSTTESLSIHYSISEIGIADIDNGEAKGHEIILKGNFGSYAEGLPNLPFENRYIAVPRGAKVSVKVKEKASQTFNGIDLLPAAAVQLDTAVGLPKLRKDMDVFGKDANFPSENVAIAQTTQIRGLDVALLSVTPFRYNPVRKTLEVIYDMDIEVRFEGGNGQFGEARYRNPAWDDILSDLVINSDMLPEAHYYELLNEAIQNREEGCEYLIIAPDDEDILAYADTLRQFRTKQGVLSKVVSTTECGGNTADQIKSYIHNAYVHWAIPPAAVMIFSAIDTLEVGSNFYWTSSGIPGFGLLFKGYDTGTVLLDYHYSSDNPYADMNGDSIPDLALSRLPAITLDEYRTQVNKLIQYETNPPSQSNYYDRPIVTSSYENNKWFLITSQSVNGFYRNKLGRHPHNFYMVYAQSEPIFPDTAWSTGYNTDAVVNYFGPNGQNYIAHSPDTLNDWRDPMDYSYLLEALNQSSFLTLYRDHSSFDLWCSPWMESSEIQHLTNQDPTFVLSIGCDAALYSKVFFYEFSDSYWSIGKNPMIYEFCKAKGGALGGIGATTVTCSHFNDILTWGILDNFWSDFMPDLGTATQPEFTRPAYALVAGKLFLNQHVFMPNWWPQKVTTTMNVFHYLGDTYLNLYTEAPQQMNVDAGPCTNSQSQYTFTAEEGALVCLSHGNDIIRLVHATGRPQSIVLPNLPIGDRFFFTVTKQNRIRFEQQVTVISPSQPYVYTKDFIVNGQCNSGELVDFDIVLRNNGQITSDNGEITLVCESPYVEIVQNSASYQHISPYASVTLERAFSVRLTSDIPDQAILHFTIRFNENENTHEDVFHITANAPIIQISPEFAITTENGEPSTHIDTEGTSTVTFSLSNIGHSTTCPISADLGIKAPFVSSEASQLLETLRPEETTTFSIALNATPNDIEAGWLQAQLLIQYGAYQARFDTIMQYGGIFENFESDTLNPFFNWTNSGSHPWEYCTDDVFEGERCFISTANTATHSQLRAKLRSQLLEHDGKISFHYKTSPDETLVFYSRSINESTEFTSPEWQYGEVRISSSDIQFIWNFEKENAESQQTKIDNICFPPKHTVIAYAGDDMILCNATSVTLNDAYAYDYQSVFWTSDSDGQFEDETAINATYHFGEQDIINGNIDLTLHASSSTDTISSTIQLTLLSDFSWAGRIEGDSIVNKYETATSHYSIEHQEGIRYRWQIEPAEAGYIYGQGNAIDIAWNLCEGDAEVTLSVITENGCDTDPITKTISLIGYSTPEWHPINFDLYPNPTDGKVNLVVGENLHGMAIIEVYNLLGERVLVQEVSQLHQGTTISLDLNKMASGLYIIKLSTANGSCSKKVSVR